VGSGSDLAGTTVVALVANPKQDVACAGRRGTGYIELMQALGRTPSPVCQTQAALDSLLESWVDEIAPAASVLVLGGRPASSSIRAALNGRTIFRSRWRGFDYRAETRALLFFGLESTLSGGGNQLEVSYVGW
jgi:hypothetical protein